MPLPGNLFDRPLHDIFRELILRDGFAQLMLPKVHRRPADPCPYYRDGFDAKNKRPCPWCAAQSLNKTLDTTTV